MPSSFSTRCILLVPLALYAEDTTTLLKPDIRLASQSDRKISFLH
jgi:hypothetical protein